MDAIKKAEVMLASVATALGTELLDEVAFVGGCTTGLLVTDEFSKQSVRFTDDVDLIVHVIGKSGWYQFQDQLKALGFTESMDDGVNCRMRIGDLKVDFMPDDEEILGFTNRWYQEALASAKSFVLENDLDIRIVSPNYFIATKIEAFRGRGNNDPLGSHDMEDILILFDGRPELIEEIKYSSPELAMYISLELQKLLSNPNFEYAVSSAANNVREREAVLFERIGLVIENEVESRD